MLRAKWEFEYTASTLAAAAKSQHDFRAGRVDVWEGKKLEVIQKIKDTGLTVHEGIAAAMNSASNNFNPLGKYTSTQMAGATVLIDQTLQRDLDECVEKIQTHKELQRQYAAWKQVLEGNPESRVKLDHDDWMFFFGK